MEAHRIPDALDAEFEDIGNQRRADRRASDRRSPRLRLDPLFAATLINHTITPELCLTQGYAAPKLAPRNGVVVNLKA